MALIKKGIAASGGIAIGKAFLYEKQKIEINQDEIKDTEIPKEIKKIDDALASYGDELKTMEIDTEVQRQITEAHLNMLDDPFLIDSIHEKIKDKMNAEKALDETIQSMVQMMSALDDPYLKERATDYRDIGERLLYKIKGIEVSDLSSVGPNTIVVSEELTPSDTSTMNKDHVIGFLMDRGGKTAHVSIIAQTLGIPCLIAMKDITSEIKNGDTVIIDTENGDCYIHPEEDLLEDYKKRQQKLIEEEKHLEQIKNKKAITKDGKKIEVATNIGNIKDLEYGLECGADSVGLFRTEFLYMDSDHFPTEEEQLKVYQEAVELLGDRGLIIRTLDIGGDKALSYFEFPHEDNPFLGWRAIRICFDKPEIFKTQLRAILRASAFGKIRILLPMIISVEEIKRAKAIIDECKKELKEEKIDFDEEIEIGIMVETPASVLMAEELIQHCDYFSIGTNDLTQYFLAVDRGNQEIAELYNTYHPAVLRAIKTTIDASHKAGKWTGMCGGFAGETKATKLLLGLGLDEFSAPGASVAKIKDIILNSDQKEAKAYAEKLIAMESAEEIQENLE
ncbi:MAG: phosphoenolpyruvate--protein phosphotransferase [Tissierellia bacterium]|nr:phosphoenolpyruvate--protein phosphotransferase [Tissierellia bacterium]